MMVKSLVNILINPNAFFKDASAEKESLKIPGLIVLALGIVSAVNAYLVGGLTGKMMAGMFPGMESIIAISTILGALIAVFIVWVIWTGVFYLLSSLFKGKGTFKRTLEFVGFGYLPQIFGVILIHYCGGSISPKSNCSPDYFGRHRGSTTDSGSGQMH